MLCIFLNERYCSPTAYIIYLIQQTDQKIWKKDPLWDWGRVVSGLESTEERFHFHYLDCKLFGNVGLYLLILCLCTAHGTMRSQSLPKASRCYHNTINIIIIIIIICGGVRRRGGHSSRVARKSCYGSGVVYFSFTPDACLLLTNLWVSTWLSSWRTKSRWMNCWLHHSLGCCWLHSLMCVT